MHFEGTVSIKAPREAVWAFLTDANAAAQCAPGLESLEVADETHFSVVVRTGVGPVKGRFTFNVTWLELSEPTRARFQARGKLPGSAVDMESSMNLSESDGGTTTMEWLSEVKVNGLLASVGARLMQGAAEKTTNEMFECIRHRLESGE